MEKNTGHIELKSPKVQGLIGKIPRRLVVAALIVYACVLVLLLVVGGMLGLDWILLLDFLR